ncbi:hypothetical protein ACFFR3_11855 [Nonomuraea salmonea]|uniref:Serine/threonine protein kinase n=1 Tax=Nonomuraea salmonea TaxID=46181 RepID=A0ABV5NJ19_9ACTN
MSVEELRDVLRERAEGPAPANPYRHEQVRDRVRRVRRRRTTATAALAGAAAVATVLATAAITGVIRETPRPGPLTGTVSRTPEVELPAWHTSSDGTAYRRLAAGTVDARGAKTTLTVPRTGRPLEAAVLCDGGDPAGGEPATGAGGGRAVAGPEVFVDGRRAGPPAFACAGLGMRLRPLEVPAGTGQVAVTFDTTGATCVLRTADGPCTPERPGAAHWRVAVYEWTPPARPVIPAPATLPARVDGAKQVALSTGTWPGDGSYEATVVAPGRYTLQQNCSGDLRDRLWFKYWIDGVESRTSIGCGTRTGGAAAFTVRKGQRVEVKVRTGLWGASTNRPVDWAVALYRR